MSKFFQPIRKILKRVIELDSIRLMDSLFEVYKNEITNEIIFLNTGIQLFEKGINAEGKLLSEIGGDYAESTVINKKSKGLPFDRITLFDEGDFYDSFKVEVVKGDIVIFANTIKMGIDLQDRWSNEMIGLTEESKSDLVDFLIHISNEWLPEYLLSA